MICSATRRAWLIGMEKPTPMDPLWPAPLDRVAMAELTPMTRPRPSTSGPPELPGLIAASVWIALRYDGCEPSLAPVVTGRLIALTMPLVTVPASPSGDPMAIDWSPTTTESESPRVATGSPVLATLSTARSYEGERPTILPGVVEPSLNCTVIWPPAAAAATTWLLVRM